MYTVNIIEALMNKGCNLVVKIHPKMKGKSDETNNDIMIKKFLRKWKKSGIAKELKEKSYPQTRGMKERKKRYLGKRRNNRSRS